MTNENTSNGGCILPCAFPSQSPESMPDEMYNTNYAFPQTSMLDVTCKATS